MGCRKQAPRRQRLALAASIPSALLAACLLLAAVPCAQSQVNGGDTYIVGGLGITGPKDYYNR